MRLMESGWTNQLSQLIKNAIGKRIEGGQTPNTIKFEQLYGDVIDPARGKSSAMDFFFIYFSIILIKTVLETRP